MAERGVSAGAAFYARRGGRWADWWTLLHPPYTLWHLAYPAIGASLAPHVNWWILVSTLLAFLLAVGVSAHALDELHDRPLGTGISDRTLQAVAATTLIAAAAIGVAMIPHSGPALIAFIPVGVLLVLGYNLELFGGRLHTDIAFAAAWGGFPVAVGFIAQAPQMRVGNVAAASAATLAATGFSYAQRSLSTPARIIRRRVRDVIGVVTFPDGTRRPLDRATLLAPLETALRTLSWAIPVLAAALLLARFASS